MATVMVVEDDKAVLTLVTFLLEKDGHKVLSATNGEEALEVLEKHQDDVPKVLVLDIMMPKMDGYTLNAKLQADPRFKDMATIVLTAKGGMKDLFEVAPNVSEYIEKPFEPAALRKTVKDLLARASKSS